jgi:hypothetical protein
VPDPADLAAQLRVLADQVAQLGGGDQPGRPVLYPADVLNLRPWKLTLPVAKGGKVVEVRQPELAAYINDRYFGLTDDKTGVRFCVWHGGATTSGSANPRSELREMTADGSDERAWSWKSGHHTMEIVGQVNRLTKVKPHTVIGQIHGKSDDLTVWRVEGSKLYATKGNDPHAHLVDGNFQLGQPYTIKFDVTGGKCSYYYNGTKLPFTLSSSDTASYFKAGAYLNSNPTTAPTESPDEYTEVVINRVTVTHS